MSFVTEAVQDCHSPFSESWNGSLVSTFTLPAKAETDGKREHDRREHDDWFQALLERSALNAIHRFVVYAPSLRDAGTSR